MESRTSSPNGIPSSSPMPFKSVLLVTSPFLWSISTARWGSYLPRDPIFFTDLFASIGVVSYLAHIKKLQIKQNSGRTIILIFLYYLILVAVNSLPHFSSNFVRDLAPYAYYFYFVPLSVMWCNVSPETTTKIAQGIKYSLLIHLAWCSLTFYFPVLTAKLPLINESQNLRLFSIRPDFDTLLVALTCVLILKKVIFMRRFFRILLIVNCLVFIFFQNNRSSMISFALLLMFFFLDSVKQKDLELKLLWVIAFSAVLVLLAPLISRTGVYEKFIGLAPVLSNSMSTEQEAVGSGTASARLRSWNSIIQFIGQDTGKVIFGVGFGPDFLAESGGLRELVNEEKGSRVLPRQPHNFALNTYARIGFVGTFILMIFHVSVARFALRKLKSPEKTDLDTIVSYLYFGLIPISLLGVVMESPFGAMSTVFTSAYLVSYRTPA